MTLKVFVNILGLLCAGMVTAAFADFQVNSEYPRTGSCEDVQRPCFRRPAAPLSLEEQEELVASLPIKGETHFYGRLSVNLGSTKLKNLSNNSPETSVFFPGSVPTSGFDKNQTGLELALGYFFSKNLRLELEFLADKNLTFALSPVLIFANGPPANWSAPTLNSSIKNNTLLLNGYYEPVFAGYDRFHPFVTIGFGVSINSIQSNLTPTIGGAASIPVAGSTKKQNGGFALTGGGGFRLVVSPRVSLVASLRYVDLGKIAIPVSPQFGLNGRYARALVSFGLMYLF